VAFVAKRPASPDLAGLFGLDGTLDQFPIQTRETPPVGHADNQASFSSDRSRVVELENVLHQSQIQIALHRVFTLRENTLLL
jgi:hypothetical protein